jgi:signal transduction histidine kinase
MAANFVAAFPPMAAILRNQHQWVLCIAALAVWLALGWPFLQELVSGNVRRGSPVPPLWSIPFTLFGASVIISIVLKLRGRLQWILLGSQVAAVVAMTIIMPSDVMSVFLIIIAWQVAMATAPATALAWVVFQTLAIVVSLAQAPLPHLSVILGLSFVLQLSFVLTAHALRREAEAARALARANGELRSAQALLASTVRDAERLRISRELHDAWGHELTALGLQLEIASHVTEQGRAKAHVMQAKGLARDLLAKVRDAVAGLRKADGLDRSVYREARQAAETGITRPSEVDGVRGAPVSDSRISSVSPVADRFGKGYRWISCTGALAIWVALGWPIFHIFEAGGAIRGVPVSAFWFVPYALFGAAVFGAMGLKLEARTQWALLCVQVAAVAAMAFVLSWAMMSAFLIIVAWQVAMARELGNALGWVALQTLAVIGALALAPNPDLCWVIGKSFALQLFVVLTAQALRRQAETARALAQTNRELMAAQAIIANTVRDAERLRISRELHDAWGHELTALGLQLEIASHVTEPARVGDHVMQAKGLARGLLGKVRDVVAALRDAERCDLKEALEALAHSVPTPVIHVEVFPDVRIGSEQAHALMRCAQEAVTNAVKHSQASNLWLRVVADGEGVRLVARNDGRAKPSVSAPGSGLLGMRERVESLGGRLAVGTGADLGFTVDAWLPTGSPQAA